MDVKKFLTNDLSFEQVERPKRSAKHFGHSFLPSGPFSQYRRDVWDIRVFEMGLKIGLEIILCGKSHPTTIFRGIIVPHQIPLIFASCTNLLPEPGVDYRSTQIEVNAGPEFVESCWPSRFYLWDLDSIIRMPLASGVHFIVPDDFEEHQAKEILIPTLRTLHPCLDEVYCPSETDHIEESYLQTFDRLGINFINKEKHGRLLISTGNIIDKNYGLKTFGQLFLARLFLKAIKYDMVSFVERYLQEHQLSINHCMIKTVHSSIRLALHSSCVGDFDIMDDYETAIDYFTKEFGRFI